MWRLKGKGFLRLFWWSLFPNIEMVNKLFFPRELASTFVIAQRESSQGFA